MFVTIAIVLAIIGIIPIFIPGGQLSTEDKPIVGGILAVVFFLLDWLIAWSNCPSLAYPLGGGMIVLAIIQTGIAVAINFRAASLFIPIGMVLTLMFYSWISTSAFFHASDYANLIGKMSDNQSIKHWAQDIEPIDAKHIRLVPEATAIALAKTSLNQNATSASQTSVGSQYNVDDKHCTLQKVNDKLVYVIPLDHRSYSTYSSVVSIPGYIIVDAENPSAKAIYENKYQMKYSPESYFEHNLERHLYTHGFAHKILMDYSFELDDNYKPHWVVTICTPSIGYSGLTVEGVAIVDPLTGDIDFKLVKDVPSWVDRVYPEDVISDYLSYFGKYNNGWWNEIWAGLNLKKPEDITLNYGADGKCYYVTPMTSANDKDASMTDLMYTDTRTGATKRYIVSGTTEDNLLKAVDSKLAYRHLQGIKVIYENVYGRMTAIVSVVGGDGSYRGVAFLDVTNKSIIAYEEQPLNALHSYQSLISQSGEQISTDNSSDIKIINSIVSRLNYEQTANGLQLDIYIDSIPHDFYVSCSTYPDAPFTQKGDSITLSYYNTPASGIGVTNFRNKNVKIANSDNQTSVAAQNTQSAIKDKNKVNANDFKGKVNEMSDAQIDSMNKAK